jgi:hypothetical protein
MTMRALMDEMPLGAHCTLAASDWGRAGGQAQALNTVRADFSAWG